MDLDLKLFIRHLLTTIFIVHDTLVYLNIDVTILKLRFERLDQKHNCL